MASGPEAFGFGGEAQHRAHVKALSAPQVMLDWGEALGSPLGRPPLQLQPQHPAPCPFGGLPPEVACECALRW